MSSHWTPKEVRDKKKEQLKAREERKHAQVRIIYPIVYWYSRMGSGGLRNGPSDAERKQYAEFSLPHRA